MKSCVTSSTEATIQSDGSVYMEALVDPDNSVDCEYGFCYGSDSGPLSNGNSINAIRNEYKISATFLFILILHNGIISGPGVQPLQVIFMEIR
jgi:hypothetical protein